MILLSKKDAAAGSDGGKVSSPNFDTIICVLFSRWKRSSLVDAPTGESVVVVVVVVVSTKTPRCFCPWCFASPDRAASARTTTQTDRKDDRIISLEALDVRWGKMNGAVVRSLSLSLFDTNTSVVQRKKRDARSTKSDKTTRRRFFFFASSVRRRHTFSLLQVFCVETHTLLSPKEKKKKKKTTTTTTTKRRRRRMGQTVYHGVAKNVYVAKEALIGLALGVVAGCGWKYSHWQRRGEIERYYEKMPKN